MLLWHISLFNLCKFNAFLFKLLSSSVFLLYLHIMRILIVNGPNLNLLGQREPEVYGLRTANEILDGLRLRYKDIEFDYFQSNHEGALIDRLQQASGHFDGILLNAGGYSHTSIALRDCIAAISTPVVEVHMSNVFSRESFRHESLLSAVCVGMICGFGADSYRLGVESFLR